MKLPNGERAVVDLVKLVQYCLNTAHPRGKHKARVFASALGLGTEQAERLRDALLAAARKSEALVAETDAFGHRYVLNLNMDGPAGPVEVRSVWIVRAGEDFPRLVSCFVM